jgi:hypothetical protein
LYQQTDGPKKRSNITPRAHEIERMLKPDAMQRLSAITVGRGKAREAKGSFPNAKLAMRLDHKRGFGLPVGTRGDLDLPTHVIL